MRMNCFRNLIIWNLCWFFLLVVGAGVSLGSNPLEEGLTAYEAEDYQTAMSLWKPMAEQGNAEAQYNIGVMYNRGQGVAEDPVTALKWYRLAADQGHAKALYNIGEAYRTGRGVDRNMGETVKWYQKAADLDYPNAQYALGLLNISGQGLEKNEPAGLKLVRAAAQGGFADAEYMMGMAYLKGFGGLIIDEAEALQWFRKAAEQGHLEALYAYGFMNPAKK